MRGLRPVDRRCRCCREGLGPLEGRWLRFCRDCRKAAVLGGIVVQLLAFLVRAVLGVWP